ncbi:SRPBCC domain-containing protein [Parasulfuritortus cantonensis]|uniref:SRPBCC domain-containing protein n=1 Tax=Parasulfuritortus cantonensis TaxID=2528202 RepID=A0A4R1B7X9_9PROT|nr:SRPBCC domain-containing protein [Parasulfuritortus cantonensis]TCJ12818.1 SRPBCC domain-containing protein [Parasulfuritortus cantonensis]
MLRLETQIDIAAPVERVWSLLVDFASYSRWNPFVRSIDGIPTVGRPLEVFIQPPGSGGMRFRPTVLVVEPNRELRWKGKLLLPGLFDGEHYFRLETKPEGGLVFRHGETFSGILVPLFRRSLDGATKQGFVAMNEALKREAEKP